MLFRQSLRRGLGKDAKPLDFIESLPWKLPPLSSILGIRSQNEQERFVKRMENSKRFYRIMRKDKQFYTANTQQEKTFYIDSSRKFAIVKFLSNDFQQLFLWHKFC
jgi:hypothetical protein